ncbi:MAG TPA: hypothetical protein PLP86_05730 [Armatimonadota bacterium]|nr:hypothetical protein [Armatimonadota bacterium]
MISYGSQAVWANGKIHWYGGHSAYITDAVGNSYGGWRTATHSIYDPATDTWVSAKYDGSGPQGVDNNGDGEVLREDDGLNAGVCQSFAYDVDEDGTMEVLTHAGNSGPNSGNDGGFSCYDPDTDSWSYFGEFPGWAANPEGSRNQQNGLAILHGNSVYCFGGYQWGYYTPEHDNQLKAFAKYTFTPGGNGSGTWEELADAPIGFSECAGAIINGKMYVAGGFQYPDPYGPPEFFPTSIWEYDIASNTWTTHSIANLLAVSAIGV